MLWIITIIWIVLMITCAVLNIHTKNEIYTFILLISMPIMFYLPFLFIKQCYGVIVLWCYERKQTVSLFFLFGFFFVRVTYEKKFEKILKFCYNFYRKKKKGEKFYGNFPKS